MRSSVLLMLFLYINLLITSCVQDKKKISEDIKEQSLELYRFEQDLFGIKPELVPDGLQELKDKYGSFFELFAFQITRLGSRDSAEMNRNFIHFLSDTNFRAVYTECEKVFPDFETERHGLENAFTRYSSLFPGNTVPKVITMLSVFSYPIVVDSTSLGIGLDMYLGTDNKYYFTLEPPLPLFLRKKMRKEYIVTDAMKGWLESDYGIDESRAKIVDMMISQGRTLCALDKIVPDVHDTLKSGFSSSQLEWCTTNEAKIWSFFIENKLLFSDDPNLLQKYVSDGPTTNGFPKESPGNIGKFAGWMIVRSYMDNHPDVSVKSLMEEKDLMKIFQQSKYKPAK